MHTSRLTSARVGSCLSELFLFLAHPGGQTKVAGECGRKLLWGIIKAMGENRVYNGRGFKAWLGSVVGGSLEVLQGLKLFFYREVSSLVTEGGNIETGIGLAFCSFW